MDSSPNSPNHSDYEVCPSSSADNSKDFLVSLKIFEISNIILGPLHDTSSASITMRLLTNEIKKFETNAANILAFVNFITGTKFPIIHDSFVLGYFCILPADLILHILAFLNFETLHKVGCVSTLFRKLYKEDRLYKPLCIELGYKEKPNEKSWRWLCQSVKKVFFEKPKNGLGNYTWPEKGGHYVGEWMNDGRHGFGIQTWLDGSKYTGEWREDKRCGSGTMTWADGQKYVGDWKNSRKEGKGVEVWADGRKYIGEYKNSNMHGYGVYSWPGGDKYEGDWKDDNMHGSGTYSWPNGSKYIGSWEFDEHNGFGIYTCPGGESFEGEWRNNARHGKGIERWASGHAYNGEWKENKKHGKGKFSWPDGDEYYGDWIEGKKLGKGILVRNKNVYAVEWSEYDNTNEIEKGLERAFELGCLELFGKVENIDVEAEIRKRKRIVPTAVKIDKERENERRAVKKARVLNS